MYYCALSSCQALWAHPQPFQFLRTQCTSSPICIVRPRYVLAYSLIYQCTRHVNIYKNVYDAYALCTFSLLLPSNVVSFIARSTSLLSTLKYMAHQLVQFYIFILNWIFVLPILYNLQFDVICQTISIKSKRLHVNAFSWWILISDFGSQILFISIFTMNNTAHSTLQGASYTNSRLQAAWIWFWWGCLCIWQWSYQGGRQLSRYVQPVISALWHMPQNCKQELMLPALDF